MLYTVKGFDLIKFDEKLFTSNLDKQLGIALRQATRAWLRTWLSEGVPEETGMARASFKPLGQLLRVAVPIKAKRKPYYSKLEGGIQNINLGIEKQSFELGDRNFIYSFSWKTETLHYFLSQFYNGKFTPGEFVIEQAGEAFLQYLDSNLRTRVPSVFQYLKIG